jgi:putative DNA primase/helicase
VRFVGIAETKRGVELEESVVKQISRQDTISARAPYGKPFKYRPQFKIWMSTNHKPEIPDGSEAIWDRMKLIPFTQRFEGKKADTDLPEKLREELSGILTWVVQGAVKWAQHGLGSAAAVDAATSEYRTETDVTERFFEDECVFGEEYCVSKKGLFEAWETWCDQEGIDPGTQNFFTRNMGERGVVKNFYADKIDKNTRGWLGIGLRKNPQTVSEKKVSPSKKSCKQMGDETSERHFSENGAKVSEDSPHVNSFEPDRKKVSPDEKVSPTVTTPLSWESDGVTIRHMPEGE